MSKPLVKKDFVKENSLIPKTVATVDLDKLSKQQLVKMVRDSILPMTNPEKYKEIIKAQLPDLVKEMDNKEDMATSIFETGQEMMLVIFDCLRRYHKFGDLELKQLNKELTDVLTGVKEFETAGLSMLSPHSVGIVGDNVEELGIGGLLQKIAEQRYIKAKMSKARLELPKMVDEKPFTKQLNGKSKK